MPRNPPPWENGQPEFGYAGGSHGPDGVVDEFATGLADVAAGGAFTVGTRVNCGSVAKLVTAYLVTHLWPDRDERAGLRIGAVLPGLPGPLGEATVEDCLTHRTGLWDFRSLIPLFGERSTFAYGVTDALEIAVRQTGVLAGFRRQYSNTNYLLLGLAVERAGGAQLAQLVADLLGTDVGTVVTAPRTLIPRRARGYELGAHGEVLEFGSFVDGRGSTNLWADAGELAMLMARVTDGYTRRPAYGGLVLSDTTFYAAGQDGGFRAGALVDVTAARCHVAVTNDPALTPPELLDRHAGVRVGPTAAPETTARPATGEPIEVAGDYACASLGVVLSFELADDVLLVRIGRRELGRLERDGAGFSDGHLSIAGRDGTLLLSVNHADGIPLEQVAS